MFPNLFTSSTTQSLEEKKKSLMTTCTYKAPFDGGLPPERFFGAGTAYKLCIAGVIKKNITICQIASRIA